MAKLLKTNTAIKLLVGPFVDCADGVTPETAMTVTNITCELLVEGVGVSTPTRTAITLAASGSNNDMVHITDDVAGFYSVELTAAQLNFIGRATLSFTDADVMCPVVVNLDVISEDAWDLLHYGFFGMTVDYISLPSTSKISFKPDTSPAFDATHCILRLYDASEDDYSFHVIQSHTDRGAPSEKITFYPPIDYTFDTGDTYAIMASFVLPPTIRDLF